MSSAARFSAILAPYGARSWCRYVGAVALLILMHSCAEHDPNAPAAAPGSAPPALPVTVQRVQRQALPLTIEVVGQTEGAKEIQIRARVAGILDQQHYREGEPVAAQARLYSIDPKPFNIAVAQAQAAVSQQQAILEQAQREQQRLQPLVSEKAVSQREYDDTLSQVKMAQAQLRASEASLQEAKLNLSYTEVTTPIAGITGRTLQSLGSLVTPGTDSGLLTTINVIDPMWVRFSFSESQLQQFHQSQANTQVKLILANGASYAELGRLNFSASQVDTRTGTIALRAEFPNPEHQLLPGQFVRVRLETGQRQAILVPQAAVMQSAEGMSVYVVSQAQTAEPRNIATAGWDGPNWVVTHGLEQDEQVIVDNLMKLRPGAAIDPLPAASASATQ